MAGRTYIIFEAILVTICCFISATFCDDIEVVPANASQLNSWFGKNVQPLLARKGTLDPTVETAEANTKVIKVNNDGSGDFKTINDAIKSIPDGNTNHVIISIGGGNYTEKIKIERTKPFITFYGDPKNMPILVFGGTTLQYTIVESATLIVESNYFNAVNIILMNSAPRLDGKMKDAQAAALRIGGDKASFYNCKFHGFQDTLCDDRGLHFFKDCYIEGTVDFIFGNGKSYYLSNELHVIPRDQMAMIGAHARESDTQDTGYFFVHCKVIGTGGVAFLGRAWKAFSRILYAYTEMSDVVNPQGWSNFGNPANDKTEFFAEYQNSGPGFDMTSRVSFVKKLTDEEAKPFITLGSIQASKWLLPLTTI